MSRYTLDDRKTICPPKPYPMSHPNKSSMLLSRSKTYYGRTICALVQNGCFCRFCEHVVAIREGWQ